MFRIKPRVLDNVIGRIILPGQISVFHGPERFPLTAIAHAIAVGGAQTGTSAYLDSGSNFRPQLVRRICGDTTCEILNRVIVGSVLNLRNLQELVAQLKSMKPSVVILDSLTGVMNMSHAPGSKLRQRELFATLETLRDIVHSLDIHMMIADHSTKNWRTGEARPIGGNVIEHAVDSVVSVLSLPEVHEGVKIQVDRSPITPSPGGVIVRIGHRGIRSLKST
ncbi:MAG: hypothetical protein P1Q69_02240 [Candidatus Thorarchaeota archaeon]|nr:hypothetical protein [Candidatus Thorarchaeota archaeon]